MAEDNQIEELVQGRRADHFSVFKQPSPQLKRKIWLGAPLEVIVLKYELEMK